ncbi:PAS domain S-box protein [Pseudanabaena minima]|uniref:PAS domain S-box protein n=1 Tax=Pseudanabaena minima TaxID=890415 RepID=UPI003DA8070F
MGMRLCLELIATSIQQLHQLEHIAVSPVSSSEEIETRSLNLEDAVNILQASLTELEVCQRSLAGELDKYRELFDFAPDGYFVTDANGDISEANRAATLMFGSQPIGQNLENFVYPSYKEQFQILLGQLQRGQNIKSLDFRMQFPTGQPFDASFTIISIRTPLDGRVTGMRWWIQDITQRKQEIDKLQQSHQRLEIRVAEMNAKLNLMDRQIRVEREEQRRISRNLTRNEAKLRAMMQYSSDIVNILDIDTTIHYCSPALFKTLGYLPEDVIGKKFVQFIHPDDLPIFQNFLTQSVDTLSVSTPIVMRYQHINGDWIHLESVCCNLLQDANVQGLVINSRDITERKRTETALHDSELRLAAIASSMPATLYRLAISPEGKISIPFISDGLIDLVGISPRYAISSPYQLLDLIHPEDVDQFKALIKAGFDKLATFRHEFRVIAISGEVRWVQNIARYYRTDSGSVFADGVCIDISERGEAESSLQRTNELLRAVIKAVPVAIDIVSPEGKVLLWNAAAEKLFAWNSSAIVGYPVPSIPESQALKLQAAILDTLSGKPLDDFPMTFQLRDGSWTNVSISTVLVHDPHGKIVGVLRIIDEVGDRFSISSDYSQTIELEQVQNSSLLRSGTEAIANYVTINANTLLNQYKIGQRNFAGLNLRGAYFVEANLQQVDFSGAALNGSNCSHANFQAANLRGADLRGANFQYADLQHVDLRGADLRGTDLRDANTTGAILDESNLQGAILSSDLHQ